MRARLQIPDQFGSGHGHGHGGKVPCALTRRVSRCVVCSLLQLTFPMDWNVCIDDANTEQVQASLLFTEHAHKANGKRQETRGRRQEAGGNRTRRCSIQSRRAMVVSPQIAKCPLGDEVFHHPFDTIVASDLSVPMSTHRTRIGPRRTCGRGAHARDAPTPRFRCNREAVPVIPDIVSSESSFTRTHKNHAIFFDQRRQTISGNDLPISKWTFHSTARHVLGTDSP